MIAESQRGAILIASLVFLLVMTVVGISALDSNTSQYRLSGNFRASIGALGLAEQGARMSIDEINGPGMPTESLDSLLALAPVRDLTPGGELQRIRTWIDNDDGDSDPLVDSDGVIILASVGYEQLAKRRIEIRVETGPFVSQHAFLSGGAMNFRGDGEFGGGTPRIHANGDIRFEAGSNPVLPSVSATGEVFNTPGSVGSETENAPGEIVPFVDPGVQSDGVPIDYRLDAYGDVRDNGDNIIGSSDPVSGDWNGWLFTDGVGWEMIGSPTLQGGNYFVDTNVILSGKAGDSLSPWTVSIFAEGNIEVTGEIVAAEASVGGPGTLGDLFVAGGDILINDPGGQKLTGAIAAHEQVMIVGDPTINGLVFAQDAENSESLVDTSSIDGNPTFSSHAFKTAFKSRQVSALSWREII